MTRRVLRARRCTAACAAGLALAGCAGGPPPASHEDIVRSELAGIIAATGAPCGRVVEYGFDDRLDYRVLCEAGLAYRVLVTAEGHVQATPRPAASAPWP